MTLDKRAVQVLTSTFWTSAGWRREPQVSPSDFAYAKSKGIMFDPLALSHDEAVEWAITARDRISQSDVVSAFIVSLRSRRADLRSGLASYAVARHLPRHRLVRHAFDKQCTICGAREESNVDLNVLSFERVKWGGVRHFQPSYIGFDLTRLAETAAVEPVHEDYETLQNILAVARSMRPGARLNDLDRALGSVIPSNSSERRVLIGILGYCGILIDPTKPNFREHFVPCTSRERTTYAKDDWPFPVQWWNGSHGVAEEAVDAWFPALGGS